MEIPWCLKIKTKKKKKMTYMRTERHDTSI